MKPTEKQIKVIDTVLSIIKTWKNTDDINSSTHIVDIHNFLFADLENRGLLYSTQTEEMEDLLCSLFNAIKTV
jgi:hypothetical protein